MDLNVDQKTSRVEVEPQDNVMKAETASMNYQVALWAS